VAKKTKDIGTAARKVATVRQKRVSAPKNDAAPAVGDQVQHNGHGAEAPVRTQEAIEAEQLTGLQKVQMESRLATLLQESKKNFRNCDQRLIKKAFHFCVDAHKMTIRASGEPYYTHPYEVALIVAREIPLDDVSVAAALLHDVVEDTEYTVEDIRAEFGPAVAEIVDGATKITDVFNSHEVTQAASYRKLLLSMVNDVRVILIKFADRLHNMRTLEYLSPQKQQRMARETLEIYAPFAHRFGLGNLKWELEDLSFKYLNGEIYNQIKNRLKSKRRQREEYIHRAIEPVEERLREEKFKFDVYGRAKHIYSIYNKMHLQNKDLDDIHDLVAIRIILDTDQPNDCFTVYGIVSEIYTPVPERFKNYISVPKKNGYQSIHTTVIGPDGRQIEVQIRTRKMHEIAEKGVAAHFIYKESSFNPLITEDKQLEEWVNWIRDVFDRAGNEEAPHEVLESFRLNLFQDEIYVFTPKGDLRILPKGATPIDFAFDIHSKVGFHCIGAKVNGKIVPLNAELKSGDQVEILTSKNQTPSIDWEKFAVTHKARSGVRRWLNDERRRMIQEGREAWDRRVKKEKFHINDDDLERLMRSFRYESRGDLFYDIGIGKLTPEQAVDMVRERLKTPQRDKEKEEVSVISSPELYEKFVKEARTSSSGIVVDGTLKGMKYSYAKCCSPIPGDQVIGIVNTGQGVTIHRVTCKNVLSMLKRPRTRDRALDVNWEGADGFEFMAGIRLSGEDRPGILNDITHAILSYQNTNIRSVNIASQDSLFVGTVMVMVKHTEHLERLLERLRKIRNVKNVERFEQVNAE
jgi:RelA/SpoT family (p)ppGpp synthetase